MCGLLLSMLVGGTAHIWAQPVVQVPPTCNVVVTGTGAGVLAGPGGIVGNGGVVVMPDPFDLVGVPGNFTIIPNGTISHSWQLWGDLSIQTTSTTTPTVSGTGLTQNIESYNKFKRVPSETVAPSTASLARSKGRVQIGYVISPCNAVISFDVFKSYPNTGSGVGYVPPIVGPGCWDPLTLVSYSVDPIASDNLNDAIGTDKYYWRVTNGTTTITNFYGSSDGSSITFTTPTAALLTGTWTITCCYGRANPWDGDVIAYTAHTTCVSKTVGSAIATPTFSTAPPACLNTGVTTFTATVSPTVPGYNYSWSYLGSGSPTIAVSGAQNQTVTVNGMNNDPGTLTLTVTAPGECAAKVFTYNVRRTLLPALVLGVTPSGACVVPGASPINLVVSLPAGATGNTPNWAITPAGAGNPTITPGPSSTATVTIPANGNGGEFTVTATNAAACNTSSASTIIRVRPTPVFTAGTPNCVSTGVNATFAVTVPGPGPFSYTWTTPGYTVVSGAGTASIVLTPTATAGNVSVAVCTPVGGTCCTTITRTIAPPPVITRSCYNVGLPGTVSFTVPVVAGATYSWSGYTAAMGTLASGTTSNTISFTTNYPVPPAAAASSPITLTQTSAACGVQTVTFTHTANPNGTFTLLNLGASTYMEVSGATGSPTYQWLKTCSTTPTPCTTCGTNFFQTLTNAGLAGSYGVNVIAGGCTTRFCGNASFGGARMGQLTVDENGDMSSNEITLSPNPNGGDFEISVQKVKQSGDLVMFDAYGKQVFQAPLQQGVNRFDQKKLANGTYFLRITVDGAVTMKKMEIIH